jgi:hypothetical protein
MNNMSSAFVRESENEHLNQVAPDLGSLQFYLRRENGGVHVRELKRYHSDKRNREVYEMSDGLAYALDDDQKWFIVLD